MAKADGSLLYYNPQNPPRRYYFYMAIFAISVLCVLYGPSQQSSFPKIDYDPLKLRPLDLKTLNAPSQLNPDTLEDDLRRQLEFHFPYRSYEPFPQHVWQTWKVSPSDSSFPKNFRDLGETWLQKSPNYDHFVIPDDAAWELIHHEYERVPQVLEAFHLLPEPILKADFFRYLILFARGGLYADMDTMLLKPIESWLTFNETIGGVENNAGLVIGIEADPDRPDWHDWYARRIQFCQWAIQSKRGHPALRELIVRVVSTTLRKEKSGYLNTVEGKDRGSDVMDWTGPGIFTDTLFDYMTNVNTTGHSGQGVGAGSTYYNALSLEERDALSARPNGETLKEKVPGKDAPQVVLWEQFTNLRSPKLIDDILILPITSFSPGIGHSGAGDLNHHLAYIRHTFEGSWKD
ncbi:BA75_01599T0 [Komagataella pastoris]|uniref:BA75_01599T0 n=1 Tax=Komagataella pastoris TaxID=4922 RepID=A0A1B2J9Z0_PICPA|nr:BA75_01599T0 [Komagataella pastoris]